MGQVVVEARRVDHAARYTGRCMCRHPTQKPQPERPIQVAESKFFAFF